MRLSSRAVLSLFASMIVSCFGALDSVAETLDSSVTALISRGSYTGAPQSNAASINPRVSRNGRFVVFESVASNLVSAPSVTPGRRHVYLLDRQANSVELVSLDITDAEGQGDSSSPSVSADGRYVAFVSNAPVSSMVKVCLNACNVEVAFPGSHVYVRDRLANKTSLVSQATLPVREAAFNETGSVRNQLTENDPLAAGEKRPVMTVVNRRVAAFKIDLDTFAITQATSSNPVISADGRYIAYDTDANTVAGVGSQVTYRNLASPTDYNATTGILVDQAIQLQPQTGWKDTNGVRDVFVRNGQDFINSYLDLDCKFHFPQGCAIGGQSDSVKPSISDDGSVVGFETASPFLALDFNAAKDIFSIKLNKLTGEIADLTRVSNTTSRILAPDSASTGVSLSADGRFITFQSAATNLVTGDTNSLSDIFVYDSKFFKMVRCLPANGNQPNAAVIRPQISGNGKYISMESAATNWGATGGFSNIYLGTISRTSVGALSGCLVELASVGSAVSPGGNGGSSFSGVGIVPRIVDAALSSAPAVVYQSTATNLSSTTDTNGVSDIFQAPFCSTIDLATDSDGDGTSECFDQCPTDAAKVEDADTDGDGAPNCVDNCPVNAAKILPGLCGCAVADTDADSDGTPDCQDGCPQDVNKQAPGVCGCGFADTDANGNGVPDCNDSVSGTPTPGATPTPNTVAGFVPASPTFTRQSAGVYLVDMSSSGATFTVSKYIVQLFRVTSSGRRYVRQQTSSSNQLTMNISAKGQYQVRYALQASGGKKSKLSPFSGSVTVQTSRGKRARK